MTVKLSSLRADMRRQNDGDWVEVPALPGVELKVRGLNYGPYQADLSQVRARWISRYRGIDGVPPEVVTRDLGRLYAKHLLLEWRGFDEPYDADTAEEMLTSPGAFFGHVAEAAAEVSRTETEFVEDAAGNSAGSSGGSSTKAA